jgi:hypothetical protein
MTSTSIILSYRPCEDEIVIVVVIIVVDCSHLRRYASELGHPIFNLDTILKVFSRNYRFRLRIKNDTSRLVTLKRDLKYLELPSLCNIFFFHRYISIIIFRGSKLKLIGMVARKSNTII